MKILFICTGNICRSPAAVAILKRLVFQKNLHGNIIVDSAGTFGMYRPTPPEKEMVEAAKVLGYELTGLSKKVTVSDLNSSDLIICMDESNFVDIKRMISKEQVSKVHQFIEYIEDENLKNIPDPYCGKKSEYESACKLIEKGCQNMLNLLYENISNNSKRER